MSHFIAFIRIHSFPNKHRGKDGKRAERKVSQEKHSSSTSAVFPVVDRVATLVVGGSADLSSCLPEDSWLHLNIYWVALGLGYGTQDAHCVMPASVVVIMGLAISRRAWSDSAQLRSLPYLHCKEDYRHCSWEVP